MKYHSYWRLGFYKAQRKIFPHFLRNRIEDLVVCNFKRKFDDLASGEKPGNIQSRSIQMSIR
ncbi:MAG: hypothetical protein ACFFAJ_02560 [Candidatus Hodarchaeota archaeon]